ncbi:hypothetical protein E2C01_096769 [Portunus trituberculatus]|uniref:Uncharacterized protein n=1 Tax=Portunus trituberculatus TaxID=210409 RepID=A0A5B7K2M4_PORTR|nr:hypothetical protein [Portunus trituberculatus]
MAGRRPRSLTSAEIAEQLSFEEDIFDDNSDISTGDSYADPDYVFDQEMEEEDEQLEAQYFGMFPPPHSSFSHSWAVTYLFPF